MEYILEGTYLMYGNITAGMEPIKFTCPKLALKERDRLVTLEVDAKRSGDEGWVYRVTVERV